MSKVFRAYGRVCQPASAAVAAWSWLRVIVMGAGFFAVAVAATAQVNVPGSYSVSDNGAATYSVPIAVPPGVGGMEPKLSLGYSSQAGNGPMGLGWNLGGVSMIMRCPMTLAHDGVNRAIAWDSADRYCLDGESLVAVKDPASANAPVGAYGGDGTYYATERESFSRVQSFVDPANAGGAAYFVVKTKAGLTMEYGRTADSRIEAQGRTAVRVWALNKVSDSKGNYFSISYIEDSANGQYYPSRIDYTANDISAVHLAASNSVVFDYGTQGRPDPISTYMAGSLVKTDRLLRIVYVYTGNQLVRQYALTYGTSAATGRSELTQIDQKGPSGAALVPVKVNWIAGGKGLVDKGVAATVPAYGVWAGASARIHVMDFDGDGKQDLVLGPDGNGAWFWLQSTGTGFVDRGAVAVGAYAAWSGSSDRIRVMDIDGDGRQDIVIGPDAAGKWYWLQSNGSTFIDHGAVVSGAYGNWSGSNDRIRVIDIDGDGRQDLVLGPDANGSWFWLRSIGSGFEDRGAMITGQFGNWDGASNRVRLMDVDGDGQQDFVLGPDGNGAWWWFKGTDAGFVNQGMLISGAYAAWAQAFASPFSHLWFPTQQIRVADVNGDGKDDLLLGPDSSGNVYWLQSTGSAFIDRGLTVSSHYDPNWSIHSTDANGDGRRDLLVGPDSSGNWYNLRSTGSGLADDGAILSGKYAAWWGAGDRIFLMDVNGDGLNDVVIGPTEAGIWYWLANTATPEVVQSIDNTNGLNPTTFSYKFLTDPTVYTKGTGATYPVADVQAPMQVVSQASTGSAAAGGVNATNFAYGGLKVAYGPGARGLLGFEWTQSQQATTGLVAKTYFLQDFPFLGMVRQKGTGTSLSAWNNLSLTNYTYLCNDFVNAPTATCPVAPGKRYFVYANYSDEQAWDLIGTGLPRTTTTQVMDNYGNATSIVVNTLNPDGSASGHSKSTTNIYTQDLANWYLGRLVSSVNTVSAPSVAPPAVPLPAGSTSNAAMSPQVLSVILSLLLDD